MTQLKLSTRSNDERNTAYDQRVTVPFDVDAASSDPTDRELRQHVKHLRRCSS